MRDILVIVIIIAIALVCLGAVNHDRTVDFDYFFGTWTGVSMLWLAVIAAALVVGIGLVAGGSAAVHAAGDRHKLERELDATYTRLRAAEAQLGVAALADVAAPSGEAAVETSSGAETPGEAAVETSSGAEPPAEPETGDGQAASAPPVAPEQDGGATA